MNIYPALTGKKVFLVTHELTRTGAPLILLETATKMMESQADVSMTSLSEDVYRNNIAEQRGIPIIGFEYSFLEAAKADIVIVNTAMDKTWVKIFLDRFPGAEKKLIWWIHELSPEEFEYGKGLVYLDKVKCVLFDSRCSRDMWKRSSIALPDNVAVINPCITDQFFEAALKDKVVYPAGKLLGKIKMAPKLNRRQIRRKMGVREEDFLITLIGTYFPKKGQDLLIETVRKLLNESPEMPLKILLVGFSNRESRNQFLSKNTLSAVSKRRAFLNVDEIHGFYRASDCYVMNSQFPGECFGRVTIEAMTHKLPVLGTDAGGTSEIVEEGITGLLHPVGEKGQHKLKDNIRKLYENRALAQKMGKAGFDKVNRLFRETRFSSEMNDAILIGANGLASK